MATVALPKASKSSAAGQYLGYSLQQVRLCHHLLSAEDGDLVSFELIDDVAVHRMDGTAALEQAKSALSGNPASDKAEDLWKTLANWAELCASGEISASSCTFTYYVTPIKIAGIGQELHEAKPADADILLKKIEELSSDASAADEQISRFLAVGKTICVDIIARFSLKFEDDPIEVIRERLRILPAEVIDDYCAAAIGIARDMIDRLIRDQDPPVISATEFRKRLWAFVRKHNFSVVLEPSIGAPSDAEVTAIIGTGPLFVRQLSAIEASREMMITAVSDFLRTTADVAHWAADGLVVEDSFVELDNQLKRQHVLICDEISDTHGHLPKVERGRTIYRRCSQTSLPLEGRPLPMYFIPGAYNCLANDRHVGWHPDYEALFPVEGP